MEHSLFLRQYKYEIPGSWAKHARSPHSSEAYHVKQEPALWAFFDFENGGFQLEGDCKYILGANKQFTNSWLKEHKSRIFIHADMKPEIPAGPNDNLNNELLLYLKGSIYNGERHGLCSGILRLNRTQQMNGEHWVIYCSLVDNDLDVFQIQFKLPVFTGLRQTPGDN